jgi:hypothetical protein
MGSSLNSSLILFILQQRLYHKSGLPFIQTKVKRSVFVLCIYIS